MERSEPIINLGLACFGSHKEVYKALYKHGLEVPRDAIDADYKRGLRIGCLSNEFITASHFFFDFPRDLLGPDEVARLLEAAETSELEALLCNPSIADKLLEELYSRTGAFASVPGERWCSLVYLSRKNGRLGSKQDESHDPDLGHYRIHKGIFRLLETAPVDRQWLRVLYGLIDELNFTQVHAPETIKPALDRWATLDDRNSDGGPSEGYFTALPLKDEFRCLVASLYGRTYSQRKSGVEGSPSDPDVAMRCSYYGNAALTEKEARTGYDRDKEVFVFLAIYAI